MKRILHAGFNPTATETGVRPIPVMSRQRTANAASGHGRAKVRARCGWTIPSKD
jgi:hypothetical protein